ncbi:MAG: hypothetical protein ACI8QF_001780 [Limisphaerales bacterium]|jgi:hypothetical protein
MTELIPFGGSDYWVLLGVLALARVADFLSTWIATPSLAMEANPFARWLGWKWGILFNLTLCVGIALWPFGSIVLSTASVLVASRNFQSAWLIRAMGEQNYATMIAVEGGKAGRGLYAFCMLSQAALVALVGAAVIYFSRRDLIQISIGGGIVAYGFIVGFYSLLSVWQIRRRLAPADK